MKSVLTILVCLFCLNTSVAQTQIENKNNYPSEKSKEEDQRVLIPITLKISPEGRNTNTLEDFKAIIQQMQENSALSKETIEKIQSAFKQLFEVYQADNFEEAIFLSQSFLNLHSHAIAIEDKASFHYFVFSLKK